MRKILYCCPYKIDPTLGGAKVYIEAAKSLENQGWQVKLISPDELGHGELSNLPEMIKLERYAKALDQYLKVHSGEYDVVEYEHLYLPYPRENYSSQTLMIARSILLTHQFTTFKTPTFNTLRGIIGRLFKGAKRQKELKYKIEQANSTLENADLISVPNNDDKKLLEKFGIPSSKILVLPYGLTPERYAQLSALPSIDSEKNEIAFVGTFDLRKGAKEFPEIVRLISKEMPHLKFKLLGTSAMFPTKEAIFNYMPKELHPFLDIVPKFTPEELPALLAKSKIGIFPSHMESFGFGVLEMMAAGLPVIAYNVPGPNELLPNELLVERGDVKSMSEKVISLLKSEANYIMMVKQVKTRALNFNWNDIANQTNAIYQEKINGLKNE